MKRDMDFCRKILQCIEAKCWDVGSIHTLDIEDFEGALAEDDKNALNYHVKLLIDAGFIEPSPSRSGRGGAAFVKGLTWEGHEFVEKSRDQGLWEKAKRLAREKTGGLAIEILSPLLTALAKNAVGIDG